MYLKQVTVNGCPLFHLYLLYVLTGTTTTALCFQFFYTEYKGSQLLFNLFTQPLNPAIDVIELTLIDFGQERDVVY